MNRTFTKDDGTTWMELFIDGVISSRPCELVLSAHNVVGLGNLDVSPSAVTPVTKPNEVLTRSTDGSCCITTINAPEERNGRLVYTIPAELMAGEAIELTGGCPIPTINILK